MSVSNQILKRSPSVGPDMSSIFAEMATRFNPAVLARTDGLYQYSASLPNTAEIQALVRANGGVYNVQLEAWTDAIKGFASLVNAWNNAGYSPVEILFHNNNKNNNSITFYLRPTAE